MTTVQHPYDHPELQLTAGGLAGAQLVRDQSGWHPVVRVGRSTVTVTSPTTSKHVEISNDRILQRYPRLDRGVR